MISQNNLYNPFEASFLGIFVTNNLNDTKVKTGIILEDIDLYFQPVPEPVTASVFLVVNIIFIAIGSYITFKVLAMIRKEDGILKKLTRNFMVSQLISWPLYFSLISITNFIHSFPPVIVQWLCPVLWFVLYFSLSLCFSHSFMTSIMRYFFIVHNERAQLLGKEKAKKLFHMISILIPLLLTIWRAIETQDLDTFSTFNKCYGKHHRTFLVETSTLKVFKKNFCEIPDYHNLDGYVEVIKAFSKNVFCISNTVTLLVISSNLTEAIVYFLLFSHMYR